MYTIGPYSFTATDAERTVGHLDDLWRLYEEGRDPTVIAGLRPELTGDLGTDLALAWSALLAAGPALRAAAQLPPRAVGSVVQLNVSQGGVPKSPRPSIEVSWSGVVGDRQATRQHHGRPWQALCLWSTEVIDALRGDGHPIAPGLAGENVTITGLPWHEVRAGVRLRLGDVLCEVSAYSLPCKQNRSWFRDGDFEAMHHARGPVSRVYATVLEPGMITVGDAAVLEP